MTRVGSLITVIISALVFSLLGAIIGLGLGRLAPGYYRAVYSSGNLPSFSPVEVGLGLGLTQGFAGGALIGVLLLFAQDQGLRGGVGRWIKKYRKPLLAVALTLAAFLGFASWQLKKLGDSMAQHEFTGYVSSEFIPTQKRRTGQWPKTLNQLPRFIRAQKDYSQTDELYNGVLRFYRSSLDRFEPLHSDGKSYTYILHFAGRRVKCTSSRDDGDCTYEKE